MPSIETEGLITNFFLKRNSPNEVLISKGDIKFDKIRQKITFKNVEFNYLNRSTVLKNVNFVLEKNKFYALVGESGAGKSTISDLLLGLLSPSKGKILIDEKNLNQYDLNSYRGKISYVPQETILFNETIKNNLNWVRDDSVNDEEIWQILKFAHSEKFTNELPEKLNTLIGDRGVKLSGGQKQRLALARAFLRRPDLLILDEATNSLDLKSQQKSRSVQNYHAKSVALIFLWDHHIDMLQHR